MRVDAGIAERIHGGIGERFDGGIGERIDVCMSCMLCISERVDGGI